LWAKPKKIMSYYYLIANRDFGTHSSIACVERD